MEKKLLVDPKQTVAYHQQCHFVNSARTQANDNFEVQIPNDVAGSEEEMFKF